MQVCGLAYSKDGKYLASGGNDNKVNIWADRDTTPLHTLIEHTAAVKALGIVLFSAIILLDYGIYTN